MHLLIKQSWQAPDVFPPVYSDAVYSALHIVLGAYREEERHLSSADRLDLAAAMQLVCIAGLLEEQVRHSRETRAAAAQSEALRADIEAPARSS